MVPKQRRLNWNSAKHNGKKLKKMKEKTWFKNHAINASALLNGGKDRKKQKSSAGTKLALSDQFSDAYVGRHKHATGIDLSGTVYIIT